MTVALNPIGSMALAREADPELCPGLGGAGPRLSCSGSEAIFCQIFACVQTQQSSLLRRERNVTIDQLT
jgi:hypothetical protein